LSGGDLPLESPLRPARWPIRTSPTLLVRTVPPSLSLPNPRFARRYGETFRFATHKDVDDEGLELAAKVFADVLR
jgi:hypothetical protein